MKIRRVAERRSWVASAFNVLMWLALIGGFFGIVWSASGITAMEYQIGELEARRQSALKERKDLDASISELLSMRGIESRGLELQFPDRQNVFHVMRESEGVQRASSIAEMPAEEGR